MKKLRWQLIIIFLTGLVVGILLLIEQPDIKSTFIPEPTRGGVYTEALVGSIQRLNPVLDYYNDVDRDVDALLFSGLIKFDSSGKPQPDVAESWGISQDGTIYNFTIRPGVLWHDGVTLTSDDVIFTLELIRNENSIYPEDIKNFWKEVKINRFDEYSFQFVLPEAYAPFLDYLSFGILPSHILGSMSYADIVNAPFNLQPIGSGPYQFDHFISEEGSITGVVLTRFEDYYDEAAFLDQVIFQYLPDAASALNAYKDGTVQGIGNVSEEILNDVLKEEDLAMYTSRMPELTLVLFNLQDPQLPFFQEAEVRQALLTGLNRQWIVDRILNSQAIIANGPILPGTWAYYDGLTTVTYDPQEAIKMLKEAEYTIIGEDDPIRQKDGTRFSFTLLHPNDVLHTAMAESIKNDWEKIGVEVLLEGMSYEDLLFDHLEGRSYQAALIDINLTNSPDPDPYPFWDQAQATGGQNYSQWDNRIASDYLEQARIETDITERGRLYRNFQVVFEEDMPSLPLYYPVYNYAIDYLVQGVSIGPIYDSSDRFNTINKWFLLEPFIQQTPTVFGEEVQPQ